MKIKKIDSILFILLVIFFIQTSSFALVFGDNTKVFLSSDNHTGNRIGENITIDLKVQNVENLIGWSVGLEWDPEILKFQELKVGPFINETNTIFLTKGTKNANQTGVIDEINQALSNPLISNGYNGSGTLAIIKMRVIKGAKYTNINITKNDYKPKFIAVDRSDPSNITKKNIPVDVSNIQIWLSIIDANAGDDININEDTEVELNGSNSTGENLNYTWTFKDNGTKTLEGQKVYYTFSQPGSYNITLSVTDGIENSNDNIIVNVSDVTNPVPVIKLEGTSRNNEVKIGNPISFDSSESFDPENGTIQFYKWDFGDGENITGIGGQHTYAEEGSYKLKLEITDNHGNKAKSDKVITVLPEQDFTLYSVAILVIISSISLYSATNWIRI